MDVAERVKCVFALDNRLAQILTQVGEPQLKQIKLAWWRERLVEEPQARPKGDPLLDRISSCFNDCSSLIESVNGWEELLCEDLKSGSIETFADGRAASIGEILADSKYASCAESASQHYAAWASADLAIHLVEGPEREAALKFAMNNGAKLSGLPRALRGFKTMSAIGRKCVGRGGTLPFSNRSDALIALRIGMLGK